MSGKSSLLVYKYNKVTWISYRCFLQRVLLEEERRASLAPLTSDLHLTWRNILASKCTMEELRKRISLVLWIESPISYHLGKGGFSTNQVVWLLLTLFWLQSPLIACKFSGFRSMCVTILTKRFTTLYEKGPQIKACIWLVGKKFTKSKKNGVLEWELRGNKTLCCLVNLCGICLNLVTIYGIKFFQEGIFRDLIFSLREMAMALLFGMPL